MSGRVLRDGMRTAGPYVARERDCLDLLRLMVSVEGSDLQMIAQNVLFVPHFTQDGLSNLYGADGRGTMHRLQRFPTILMHPCLLSTGRLAVSDTHLAILFGAHAKQLLVALVATTICQLILPVVAELLSFVRGEMASFGAARCALPLARGYGVLVEAHLGRFPPYAIRRWRKARLTLASRLQLPSFHL